MENVPRNPMGVPNIGPQEIHVVCKMDPDRPNETTF